MSASLESTAPRLRAIRVETLRNATLWLFVACGATAVIEPSPYEFMFFLAVAAYARGGLAFDSTMAPLIVWLALMNAGGLLALAPFTEDQKAVTFVFISLYMALTAVFFAALIAGDPLP